MTSKGIRQARYQRPDGGVEILLIRHGESAPFVPENPFPMVDGHADPPLSDYGQAQAELVCDRLTQMDISAIYVTTLQRTAQTAAPLVASVGIDPVVVPELREVGLGEWEGGHLRAKSLEGHPIVKKMYQEQTWEVIPGAETAQSFTTRCRAGIEQVASNHSDETVAVFVHGGVIAEVLAQTIGHSGWGFIGAANASISEIATWGNGHRLRRFNDVSHLETLAHPDDE